MYMNEAEMNDVVENFKGMIWDELDDALTDASRDDLINLIRMLKARYG
jgi:hypothetical protein